MVKHMYASSAAPGGSSFFYIIFISWGEMRSLILDSKIVRVRKAASSGPAVYVGMHFMCIKTWQEKNAQKKG